MVVTTLDHARKVFRRFLDYDWVVLDTETKPKRGYGKDDALVFGRMQTFIWSMCYRGESYSFPTCFFDDKYPIPNELVNLPEFQELMATKTVVMHNANYDWMVFYGIDPKIALFPRLHCTMIGGWIANPARDKSLKARAPILGRRLVKTSTVDFNKLEDVGVYAEEDVIATDELYQMQMFGEIQRPKKVYRIKADGTLDTEVIKLPTGRIVVEGETLGKFEKLFMRLHEMPYLRSVMKSEVTGFPFNVKKIKVARKKIDEAIEKSLKAIFRRTGETFNLNSSPQKIAVLKKLGVDLPFKTAKGAPCLNSAAIIKMQMMGTHPIINEMQQHSALTKLKGYADPDGLEHFVDKKGRIHATTNTCGAVTGRTSCSNPNLQQIPSRKDIYGFKDCFEAPDGHSLIVLDHAGLELRVMGLLSGEPSMVGALNDPNRDLHTETSVSFNVDRDPTAKQLNFLLQYAGTAWALAEKLTVEGVPTTPEQAQVYVDMYARERPKVIEYREQLLAHHEKFGFIKLFTGRKRWLEDVRWHSKRDRHKAETTLSNNVVQGSGQDFLKAAIIRCDPSRINPDKAILNSWIERTMKPSHRAYLKDKSREIEKIRKLFKIAKVKYILQVHDEAIFSAPDSAAEECGHRVAEVMCWKHYFPSEYPYRVQLVVEGGIGKTWKQAKGKSAPIPLHHRADYK